MLTYKIISASNLSSNSIVVNKEVTQFTEDVINGYRLDLAESLAPGLPVENPALKGVLAGFKTQDEIDHVIKLYSIFYYDNKDKLLGLSDYGKVVLFKEFLKATPDASDYDILYDSDTTDLDTQVEFGRTVREQLSKNLDEPTYANKFFAFIIGAAIAE